MERKFRVIVADDEALIGRNIARNIEKANEAFEVVKIAFDGLEALELTAQLLPNVVFNDIKMPEMDGIALIRRIAQEFPEIRTVIISGYNDFEFARDALRHQAVDYLLKPVNPDDLRATLDRLEQELLSRQRKLAPPGGITPPEKSRSMSWLTSGKTTRRMWILPQSPGNTAFLRRTSPRFSRIMPIFPPENT